MNQNSHQEIIKDWVCLGGKAQGLIELKSLGYAVPEFSFLSGSIFYSFFKSQDILTYENLLQKKELVIFFISENTKNISFPGSYAVRSSGIEEDSIENSFAGIFSSFLNQDSVQDLNEAIFQVLLSGYSSIAAAYRQSRGIYESDPKPIGVIIQKMIQPKYSGVAFGMNVQTGNKNEVWISAVTGLGEKLVSGEVQGSEFLYNSINSDLKEIEIFEDINKKIIIEVAHLTLKISKDYQSPMDIEWAYDGQQLWCLQARPITSQSQFLFQKDIIVFDQSNIQESYLGVTTPLTFTYASTAYKLVYEELMKLFGISDLTIKKSQVHLDNMLGLVSGRVYYNINNWYACLIHFPSFSRRKKEMEDMMGLEEPVSFIEDRKSSFWHQLLSIPSKIKMVFKMIILFSTMKKKVLQFDEWFWKLYNQAEIDHLYQLTDLQLYKKIQFYQQAFLEKWSIPVLNDTKVMMDMGRVKRLLEKHGYEGELKSLIYGAEVESVKPTLEIHRLSIFFSESLEAQQILFNFRGYQVIKLLKIGHSSLCKEVTDFISLYGDRCIGELKLETITMRQDPDILFSMIRTYLNNKLHLKKNLFQSHTEVFEKSFQETVSKMNLVKKYLFKKNIIKLKESIAAREKMRMHRTRNFGLMRELYLSLGKIWSEKKIITIPRDIFYLTHSEIFSLCDGRSIIGDIKKLIEVRQSDFFNFTKCETKTQMAVNFPAGYNENQKLSAQLTSKDDFFNQENIFKGLGCSNGEIEAEVILVNSSDQICEIAGKIILTERTDPGWTPLFALAAGVIVEKGSMLSHSAVVAREMGIPAVLNIKNVTQLLRSGERVRLNGNNGTVTILEPELKRFSHQQL